MTARQAVSNAIRILVVDDDEDDYVLARDTLAAIPAVDFETEWTGTYEAGIQKLVSNGYDLCLLDYHLGEKTGLDLLREVTRMGATTPVILLTGQGSYQIDLQAMQEGALFYLDKKNLTPNELERTVRYSLDRANILLALRLANDELELRVAERTSQLNAMNHQLERALAQEKELNSLRARLVTTISHEFRTPLSVILSSTELMRRYSSRMSEEQKQERLNEIFNQIKWMTRLLNDMFTLRKAESGLLSNALEEIDLVAFCESYVDALKTDERLDRKIVVGVEGKPSLAFLDRTLLHHIVGNLLDNAIKFSNSEGVVMLTLAFEHDAVTITVTDHGLGIAAEDLPHLFEPFVRGENVQNIKGAGLGLTIVKHAVEVLGGTLAVESKLFIGTTVSARLPLLHIA